LEVRAFDGQIYTSRAVRPGPVFYIFWNGEQLARMQFDDFVFEVNKYRTFHDEKGLVGVGVQVPDVWLDHEADPYDMIVDGCQDVIEIFAPAGDFLQDVYCGQCGVHGWRFLSCNLGQNTIMDNLT